MTRRYMDPEQWQRLGDMSFKHKALLHLLQCLCDVVGVVVWNQKHIEGLAGGETFTKSDLRALGEYVVKMEGENDLYLLPHFFALQHGSLSRRKHHNYLWRALNNHFPRRDDEDGEPFVNAWIRLGVGHLLPKIVDEIHGEQMEPWKLELMKEVERSKGWLPEDMPEVVLYALKEYFAMRCRMAARMFTKTDCEKWMWSLEQAQCLASQMRRWVDRYGPNQVEGAIMKAAAAPRKDIYEPGGRSKL